MIHVFEAANNVISNIQSAMVEINKKQEDPRGIIRYIKTNLPLIMAGMVNVFEAEYPDRIFRFHRKNLSMLIQDLRRGGFEDVADILEI